MMTIRLHYVTWIIALGACGGGSDAGPLSAAEADEGCTISCRRNLECDAQADPLEACVADCRDEIQILRRDVFWDAIDCLRDTPCDGDESRCLTCEPTELHLRFADRCRAQLAACLDASELAVTCEVDYTDFEDPGVVCLLNTDIISDVMDCLDRPDCASRLACIEAVSPFTN